MFVDKLKAILLMLLCHAPVLLAQDVQKVAIKLIDDSEAVVPDAKVAVILRSGAHQFATWDAASGEYRCEIKDKCLRVIAGAFGYEASAEKFPLTPGLFSIKMRKSAVKNSAVIERSGSLRGVDGSIELVLDNLRRTYIYTQKIRLESKGRPAVQPVNFTVGRPIEAVSANGRPFKLWVVELTQDVAVVEYSLPK